MKLTKDLRMLLLGIWLVVSGLLVMASTVISVMAGTEKREMS